MKKDSVALNQSTMTMLIHNLLQDNGKKQIGLKLYEHLKSQGINFSNYVYTDIIKTEIQFGDIEYAIKTFQEGLSQGIKLTASYYNLIFNGLANNQMLNETKEFYQYIKPQTSEAQGNLPNFYTFFFIIRAGYRAQDKKFVEFFLDELKDAKLSSLGNRLPGLLNAIEEKGLATIPPELKAFKTSGDADKIIEIRE
ncbi:unnamed protein product [Ambrosiozyma monospora]|uniref:Mitochondrial 15S rRNA processing factor CCM1 n=1 Tax=Ambrosiozyma monospora TaxID=43982 RepID=A0A9W6Z6C0_AMBMO|nr:unnamed protein product [Ambrosiozyma monospora]